MSFSDIDRFWGHTYRSHHSKATRAKMARGAIDSNDLVRLRRMVRAGLRQQDLDTGLVHAARYGSLMSINELLASGANPKARQSETLYWAGLRNYADLAERLIEGGARPADRSDILCAAISNASVDTVDVLLSHGADVHASVPCYNGTDKGGDSALWTAVADFERAKKGATQAQGDLSAVHYAAVCIQRQKAMAGILCLLAAAEPDESRWKSDEARAVAAKFSEGQEDFIKAWRERRADVAEKRPRGLRKITLPRLDL